ncbi:MAG: ribosome biogenesis GTPase Der [Nitriliruptoraceae bacterium]
MTGTPDGIVVAIDGPAGAGKSTVAGRVADALGVPHVDTGALYRAGALACLRAGVDLDDGDACAEAIEERLIERIDGRTYLDGHDVEDAIRGPEATAAVSRVSAHPQVRTALMPAQRAAVGRGGVVEGRDIGTVVLPDADVKVFLTASVDERARRRAQQAGRDDIDVIAAEIAARDTADGTRPVAPLQQAADAVVIDTSTLTIDEVVDAIVDRAQARDTTPVDPVAVRAQLPQIVVVGRPNVGKSTFVNRVLGQRVAIVEERPGVTRDRVEYIASFGDRDFVITDTGGWESGVHGMAARIVEQAERAIAHADLVLFVLDGTVGVLEDDERYARLLRRANVPVLVVANKIDGPTQEPLIHELHRLGLGEPHAVSARHGRGVGDVLDAALAHLAVVDAPAEAFTVPHVAIVGRPNVGKSSLFNRLAGEDRSLVDEVAHTTRDAVDTLVTLDGRPWVFVDTAGMRRHYRRGDDTELYSVDRTRAAVESADLVLFVVDASEPLGEQDQRLAAMLRDAGCGIILVCNKWDLVDEDRHAAVEKELDRLLFFASWAPRLNVSASSGRGVKRLAGRLQQVIENYRRRVPTRELNQRIAEAVASHAPPRQGNRQLKIRYATQAEIAPPRFIVFANGELPSSYRRYLERVLRTHYDFAGVPLAIDDRRSASNRR